MMIGTYPCCNGSLWIPMPDKTPAWQREECPHCGAVVWHKLSRVDPTSWTEEDFLAEFDVDEAARIVTPKPGRAAAARAEIDSTTAAMETILRDATKTLIEDLIVKPLIDRKIVTPLMTALFPDGAAAASDRRRLEGGFAGTTGERKRK